MTTPRDFAVALLNRLSLPVTQNNIVSLVAFVGIEGGHWANAARFNPFNTTLAMPGSYRAPGTIVQAYRSWADGIEANARTLAQSNMKKIVDALRVSAPPQDFLRALSDSPWCSPASTVAGRSPECPAGPNVPCYCNYAKFSAAALYAQWANRNDGTSLAATSSGANLAIWIAVAVLLAVVYTKWGKGLLHGSHA